MNLESCHSINNSKASQNHQFTVLHLFSVIVLADSGAIL